MTTTASHQTAELAIATSVSDGQVTIVASIRQAPLITLVYSGEHPANGDHVGIVELPAHLTAQARATGTQGASEVPTWQERMPEHARKLGTAASQVAYMEAEIADLRAQLALQRKGEPADNAQGFSLWFSREDWGVIFDGVMLDIERSEKRKQANSESVSDVRAEAGRAILTAINLRTPITAPQASREVPDGFIWPEPPPSKGQSHVLFEDGYAEGWAKAIDTVRKALAAAPSPASAEDGEKRDARGDFATFSKAAHYWFHVREHYPDESEHARRAWEQLLAAAQLDGSQKAGGAA